MAIFISLEGFIRDDKTACLPFRISLYEFQKGDSNSLTPLEIIAVRQRCALGWRHVSAHATTTIIAIVGSSIADLQPMCTMNKRNQRLIIVDMR